MLENTFIHIPGIGPKTEKHLWRMGIETWETFLSWKQPVFSQPRDAWIREELETSLEHRTDIRFFKDRLASKDFWRLYEAFREKAVFLDIETSEGDHGMDEITIIGTYDGEKARTFIGGVNLLGFESAIASFDLVITYNGASFDLPFIRCSFPGISLPLVHIDLRNLLGKLKYRGGLKGIERQIGLVRDPSIADMNGYDAVKLWQRYQGGDTSALNLLVKYNRADTVNLKPLMEIAFAKMKEQLLGGIGETP
jgi:uncharacterized protein YprB with RNaseH-like and TPR domain